MSSVPAPNLTLPAMYGAPALPRQRHLTRRDGWPEHEPSSLFPSIPDDHEPMSALRGVHRVSMRMPGPPATDGRRCAPPERV